MLVTSREHRGMVRRAPGLERIPQTIQCYRRDADLGPLGEPLLERIQSRVACRQPETEAIVVKT